MFLKIIDHMAALGLFEHKNDAILGFLGLNQGDKLKRLNFSKLTI